MKSFIRYYNSCKEINWEFKIKKKLEKIEKKQQEQVPKTEMTPTEVATTNQITKILVEQQELMTKIIDLQSDMQENMNK